jgi:hypothetical protein
VQVHATARAGKKQLIFVADKDEAVVSNREVGVVKWQGQDSAWGAIAEMAPEVDEGRSTLGHDPSAENVVFDAKRRELTRRGIVGFNGADKVGCELEHVASIWAVGNWRGCTCQKKRAVHVLSKMQNSMRVVAVMCEGNTCRKGGTMAEGEAVDGGLKNVAWKIIGQGRQAE